MSEKNTFENSEYVACLMDCCYGKRELFPKEWLLNTVTHIFEDAHFRVPAKYDEMLRCLYGDYMSLPPVEKRVSTHVFTACWKEQY